MAAAVASTAVADAVAAAVSSTAVYEGVVIGSRTIRETTTLGPDMMSFINEQDIPIFVSSDPEIWSHFLSTLAASADDIRNCRDYIYREQSSLTLDDALVLLAGSLTGKHFISVFNIVVAAGEHLSNTTVLRLFHCAGKDVRLYLHSLTEDEYSLVNCLTSQYKALFTETYESCGLYTDEVCDFVFWLGFVACAMRNETDRDLMCLNKQAYELC
jgi:hypothetical protein